MPFRSVKTASWRWAIVTCWAPPLNPKGLQVTAFTLRYDASTDIFSVTPEIGDRFRQTLSRTSFEVKRINRTVT